MKALVWIVLLNEFSG